MYKILLLLSLLLTLIPISQINAQSDQSLTPAESPSQRRVPTTDTSKAASHETSPSREMLNELLFKYETVYFETASFRLIATAKQILKRKANWIKKLDPSKQIVIIGHSDQRGSEEQNKYLGALRANSVKQYLINCGVNRNRMRIASVGETQSSTQSEDESALAKNRRVEIIVE